MSCVSSTTDYRHCHDLCVRVCTCRAGYKLVSAAPLGSPPKGAKKLWQVDAIHVRVNATSPGAGVVGVVYNSTTTGEPAELLIVTPIVVVQANLDGWLRLPLASPRAIPAGQYWLGWLLEKSQGCFVTEGVADRWSHNAWPTPSANFGTASRGPSGIDIFATVLPLAA